MDEKEKVARKYEEVDIEKLHGYLQNNLGDFDEFAKYIARYIS